MLIQFFANGKGGGAAPVGYLTATEVLAYDDNRDPLDTERARAVQHPPEALTRAQGREELHSWILDQISVGMIHDRTTMTEVLQEVGYDLPRIGKDYLTVKDPETGERWRLKGDIFREGWQAPGAAIEREASHRSGPDQARECRLDQVTACELQERFERYRNQCAEYNRGRYQDLPGLERHALDRTASVDLARDAVQTLDHMGRDAGTGHNTRLLDMGLERADRADASEHVVGSQLELPQSFILDLNESATYAQLEAKLNNSAQMLKYAESKLKAR